MFDILMYLFETYIHNEFELLVDQDELTDELERAGFGKQDIGNALVWLERLAALQESDTHPYLLRNTPSACRIYTATEQFKLGAAGIGFLTFLQNVALLDSQTREMVIDRAMELDCPELPLEDLKWVCLMVLFNVPGNENAYAQMEELVFEQERTTIH